MTAPTVARAALAFCLMGGAWLAASPVFAQTAAGAAPAAPVLAGTWVSVAPEAEGPLFALRQFQFNGDRWSVEYRAYADAAAQLPLFTLNVGGVFVVGSASARVAGAHDAVFPATHRHITAHSSAGVGLFAGQGCVLAQGVKQALLDQGCGFVPALMQAMGEYDLVSVKEGRLYFGARSGDLTKQRPLSLTPHPLVPS